MKFLIVGDLHGNKPKVYYEDFDAIIAPGDFCSDATRKYQFQALREKLQNPKSKIRWYDLIGKKEAKKMIEKSIEDGRIILEYLDSYGVPVYTVPGNGDWTKEDGEKWDFLKQDHYKSLIEGLTNIIDVHHKIVGAVDYQLIGHGISLGPEYPQYKDELERIETKKLKKLKREYERDSKKLISLFESASKPVIFLSHNVPFNTPIDEITDKKSPRCGWHYGSLITRELVDKYQPLICIGGHMHEHFAKCNIKDTVCVNTGFGAYVNIFLELVGNKIKTLEFHKEK